MKKLIALFTFFYPVFLFGNFMYVPDDVGLSPVSISSLQTLSPFYEKETAAYYNPAGLVRADNVEFSLNYIHYVPTLSASSFTVNNDIVDYAVFAFVLPVTRVIKVDTDLNFGVVFGSDKFFQVPFQYYDAWSDSPAFFRYGSPQMVAVPSFGLRISRVLMLGFGTNIYVKADNEMDVNTQFTGQGIQGTKAQFDSEMKTGLIGGALIDLGNIKMSFCYRDAIGYKIDVSNTSDVYAGTAQLTTFTMYLYFYDSYAPQTLEFSIMGHTGRFDIGLRARFKRWSLLKGILNDSDMIRGNVKELKFRNTLSPAVAMRYRTGKEGKVHFYAGIGYEMTPLASTYNPVVNFVDSDKLNLGIGSVILYENRKFLYTPLKLEIGYRFGYLFPRSFTIENRDGDKTSTKISGFDNTLSFMFSVGF